MCNQEDQLQRTGSRSRKGLADTGPNWPNGEGADNRQDGITSFLPAERAEKLKRKIKTQESPRDPSPDQGRVSQTLNGPMRKQQTTRMQEPVYFNISE